MRFISAYLLKNKENFFYIALKNIYGTLARSFELPCFNVNGVKKNIELIKF